jgi:hypothetical protein
MLPSEEERVRLLIGLLLGALLGAAGVLGYGVIERRGDPCLGRCGEGMACEQGRCQILEEPAEQVASKRLGRGRRRARRPPTAGPAERESLRQVVAADLRIGSEGPSLRGTDRVDLTRGGGDGRELSSEEVDAKIRANDEKIVACIDRARKDYDLDRGKVVVGFRIERSGRVEKVRVSAPALLLRHGLHGCVRGVISSLRFPASGRALIMSYPFELR